MITTAFDYQRAASLDDAIAKLGTGSDGAKILAGGHSLTPLMKLRLSEPRMLIDIAQLDELKGIRQNGSNVEIGAATVHHNVAVSPVLRDRCPALADTAAEIGDPQVRNCGTIGGSLAHADPAADYPATLLALDAEIHVKGPGGWRVVKANDFFIGLFTVNLAPDEIIARVAFAPVRTAAYAKLHQRASHFAIVGVAAVLDIRDGVIHTARIGLTGASTHAVRLAPVEAALHGKQASASTIAAAATQAGDGLGEINSDIHASAEYRRAMIKVFTRRALERALARA